MLKRRLKTLLLGASLAAGVLASANLLSQTASNELPANYQSLSACEKRDLIWDQFIVPSYQEKGMPAPEATNVLKFVTAAISRLRINLDHTSDVAPKNHERLTHKYGSVAKISLIQADEHPFTGLFTGSDCALLRLSLAGEPKSAKNFAPSIAAKFFVDGKESANMISMFRVNGQELDYNFFKNPKSNILPTPRGTEVIPTAKFASVVLGFNPSHLSVDQLAEVNLDGSLPRYKLAPYQIWWIPNPELAFSSEPHEYREDLATIPAGTKLYDLYGNTEKDGQKIKIGEIVTQSEFLASEFGDKRLFFKHSVHGRK